MRTITGSAEVAVVAWPIGRRSGSRHRRFRRAMRHVGNAACAKRCERGCRRTWCLRRSTRSTQFPLDASGKLDRRKLISWLEAGTEAGDAHRQRLNASNRSPSSRRRGATVRVAPSGDRDLPGGDRVRADRVPARCCCSRCSRALTKVAGGDVWPPGIWLAMTVSAVVVSEAGRFRRHAALLSTSVFLAMVPFDFAAVYSSDKVRASGRVHPRGYLRAGAFIACAVLAAAAMLLRRRFRDHPLGRRPVLLQHVICLACSWLATSHALRGLPQVLLWSVIATFAAFFWFLAYALMEQRTRTPAPLLHQLASYYPFLGLRTVPWGKGADNWRTIDSMTEHELAVTQLSGLKLLVWACVLKARALDVSRDRLRQARRDTSCESPSRRF